MGISSSELEEIKARLLKEGYRVVRLTPKEAQNYRVYPCHRKPWKTTEVKLLTLLFERMATVPEISSHLGRTNGACLGMLVKLGLVEWRSYGYFVIATKKFYYGE